MLDRAAFVRPIAHRGLHNVGAGCIENTAPAFMAGLAGGYGLECDLQPAADGTPMVFHDARVDRLMQGQGRLDQLSVPQLRALTYKGSRERMLTLAEFLDLAAGRGPLLVEVKSEWTKPVAGFLERIASLASAYQGPIALMSFDPVIMAHLAEMCPSVPRGIVSGLYAGEGWGLETIGQERGARLSDLLESAAAKPAFYAYHVKALPTAVTRFIREVQQVPLFTWTVRSPADQAIAAAWADAPIFEGLSFC